MALSIRLLREHVADAPDAARGEALALQSNRTDALWIIDDPHGRLAS